MLVLWKHPCQRQETEPPSSCEATGRARGPRPNHHLQHRCTLARRLEGARIPSTRSRSSLGARELRLRLWSCRCPHDYLPSSRPVAPTFDTAPMSVDPIVHCLDAAAASIATTDDKHSATATSCMDRSGGCGFPSISSSISRLYCSSSRWSLLVRLTRIEWGLLLIFVIVNEPHS